MTKRKGTTPGKETLKRSDVEAARAKSLRPEIVKQLLEMAEEGEEFELAYVQRALQVLLRIRGDGRPRPARRRRKRPNTTHSKRANTNVVRALK